MASPKDNTEVVRIIQDYRNAIYKSNSPLQSARFSRTFASARRQTENFSLADVATHLNFSNMDETIRYSSVIPNSNQLQQKLVSTEVDLMASRAALKEKEMALAMVEPATKKMRLDLEQKLELGKRKAEADQEEIMDLKTQLKYAKNEITFEKSRADECEKEKRLECNKLQMQILALQKECGNLKLELSNVKSEKAEATRKLKSEIGKLELDLDSSKQESNVSKEVIHSLKRQVEELTEKATESIKLQEELNAAQSHIKSLENKIAEDEEAALIVRAMQSDLKLLPELKKENRKLNEEVDKFKGHNILLMQEKLLSFQEKLTQSEKKNALATKLQFENDMLRNKIKEWEMLCDSYSPSSTKSPSAFSRQISKYQSRELMLTSKISKLTSHCDNLETQNKSLTSTIEQLKKSREELKQRNSGYENSLKRHQKRLFLISKERDNCRKLIDSYVSESTLSGFSLNNAHITALEDTIADLKHALENSEREIETLQTQVNSLASCKKSDENNESMLKQLEEEKAQLSSTVQELLKEKNILEEKLSSASSDVKDPPVKEEKIIHFKYNPLNVAIKKRAEDFTNLQEENDRLKKRVKVLEEEGAMAFDVTAKVDAKLEKEGSDTLLQSLKDQLAASEKQNKLILETAKTTSRQWRQAIYTMTGYKFEVPTSGKYKLSHIYADSRGDYLLFQVDDDGVHLLETEYSTQLTALIDTYLKTYDSVPAFLASHTMDLFKQQTCMLSQ